MIEDGDTCYSANGEEFHYDELARAVEMKEGSVGDVVTAYKGVARRYHISEFVRISPDDLGETAYDDVGEWAEDWPSTTKEQAKELEDGVKAFVTAWADKHGLQPTFFEVNQVEEITVRLTDENGGHEILTPKEVWISKCAKHLQDKAKIDSALAIETAEAQLENFDGDLSEDPITAAEEEMSCWTRDDGHDDAM